MNNENINTLISINMHSVKNSVKICWFVRLFSSSGKQGKLIYLSYIHFSYIVY